MSVFEKIISRLQNYRFILAEKRRQRYLAKKRKRNKNTDITIITNNCVGGIIYSDLGLKFLSPTINLFIPVDDYFEFLNNLRHYLNCEIIQKDMPEYSYPVGVLKNGQKEILVHFMHYKSFEEAKNKWIERSKRVNFDNLYIIFEYSSDTDINSPYYLKFKELPFLKKRMITYAPNLNDEEVVHCELYHQDYYPGKILKYTTEYSKKRYLDYFDYVSFFNEVY